MQILSILSILLRRWYLLVLCAVLGLAYGFATTNNRTTSYESSLTLQLNPSGRSALLPFSADSPRYQGDITTLAATYSELLRSRTFGEVVVRELSLDMPPEAVGGAVSTRLIANTNIMRLAVTAPTAEEARRLVQGI